MLGQTCRKIPMSRKRRNMKAKKRSLEIGSSYEGAEVERDDLCQVQQRDSGTSKAERFLLMKGGQERGG